MINYSWQRRILRGNERRLCLVVTIAGDEWDKCDQFTQWNDRDRDTYTKGIISNAIRVGKLGEIACGVLLKQEPDFVYREGGDREDFVAGGLSIDVKTTTKSDQCLLTVRSTVGANMHWAEKDIFIVARANEDEAKRMAAVEVVGYFTADDVSPLPLVSSRYESHKNKELKFIGSRPLHELIALLKANGADVLDPADGNELEQKEYFEGLSGDILTLLIPSERERNYYKGILQNARTKGREIPEIYWRRLERWERIGPHIDKIAEALSAEDWHIVERLLFAAQSGDAEKFKQAKDRLR